MYIFSRTWKRKKGVFRFSTCISARARARLHHTAKIAHSTWSVPYHSKYSCLQHRQTLQAYIFVLSFFPLSQPWYLGSIIIVVNIIAIHTK